MVEQLIVLLQLSNFNKVLSFISVECCSFDLDFCGDLSSFGLLLLLFNAIRLTVILKLFEAKTESSRAMFGFISAVDASFTLKQINMFKLV